MAELDKKIQKAQTDLVQSVLEAQEKRNFERVDMLVTNAIKQLKMSRFKPDQTTCICLTYLAHVCPKIFQQSVAIKDVLKSLLRRDNGPASIKVKNDIVLQVLAANILLACCDCTEIRTIILHKIEQWLSSNQKASDIVQQILATLCMKCQGDQQTIATLIEMRHHWLQYVDENHEFYSPIPTDLCCSVRHLLKTETSCDSFIAYAKFLFKHDADINSLAAELGKFVMDKPISLNSMFKDEQHGAELGKMLFKIFYKQISHLKDVTNDDSNQMDSVNEFAKTKKPSTTTPSAQPLLLIKSEPGEVKPKEVELKQQVKDEIESNPSIKLNTDTANKPDAQMRDEDSVDQTPIPPIYFKLRDSSQVIALNRVVYQASFSLLSSMNDISSDCMEEFNQLLDCWLLHGKVTRIVTAFEDLALTTPYNIPDRLRQKLIHSNNSYLIELALHNATMSQLVMLIQLFGTPLSTINTVLKRFEITKDIELIRSEIKDASYFNQLMDFYHGIGSIEAQDLRKRLEFS